MWINAKKLNWYAECEKDSSLCGFSGFLPTQTIRSIQSVAYFRHMWGMVHSLANYLFCIWLHLLVFYSWLAAAHVVTKKKNLLITAICVCVWIFMPCFRRIKLSKIHSTLKVKWNNGKHTLTKQTVNLSGRLKLIYLFSARSRSGRSVCSPDDSENMYKILFNHKKHSCPVKLAIKYNLNTLFSVQYASVWSHLWDQLFCFIKA